MEKKQRGASINGGGESARVPVPPGGGAIHKRCRQSRQEIRWRTSRSWSADQYEHRMMSGAADEVA